MVKDEEERGWFIETSDLGLQSKEKNEKTYLYMEKKVRTRR